MTKITPRRPKHSILQLHGGGALVLAQLIKLAVIEETTGKRSYDLFPSMIADSGGAIIACCLEIVPAKDLLKIFLEKIPDALPDTSFLLKQPFPRMQKRFDPMSLRNALIEILGEKTLGDIRGNLFIRTHSVETRSTRISKISSADGTTSFINENHDTRLVDIILKASAVPGIMPEREDEFIDPIADQNPLAVLLMLRKALPDTDFNFIQLGNIHNLRLPVLLKRHSFLRNLITGAFQSYAAYHSHSAHLEDMREALNSEDIMSLVTFAPGRFSSIDNSIKQRTLLAVSVLNDIKDRRDEYKRLISNFLSEDCIPPFDLDSQLDLVIHGLQALVDPYMQKEKIVTDDPNNIPVQFPTPEIVYLHDTPAYKTGYFLGQLSAHYAPAIAKQLVKHDFNLRAAFESVGRKLLPLSKLPANDEGGRNPLPPETRSIER